MKRPSKEEREAIERSIPTFELKSKAAYEALAREECARGVERTWAEVRLSHMKQQLPNKDSVRDTASVRSVHLWRLAYQRQLAADLESPDSELRALALLELERIGHALSPLKHVRGGSA